MLEQRFFKWSQFALFTLLTSVGLNLPSAVALEAKAVAAKVPAVFAQRSDAVVLQGGDLDDLLGADLETISVLSVDAKGQLQQIPFQIDERFPSGEYMLAPNRLPDTGRLSRQDEVAFMARDGGIRLSSAQAMSGFRILKEIELETPVAAKSEKIEKSWVYVAASDIPQMRSAISYVYYDPAQKSFQGKTYAMALAQPKTADDRDAMLWGKKALLVRSGNDLGPNLLKEDFVNIQIKGFAGLLNRQMSVADLEAKEIGEKIGPVRVLRKIRLHPKIAFGFRAPPVTLLQTYYDQMIVTSVDMETVSTALTMLSQIDIRFGESFTGFQNNLARSVIRGDRMTTALFDKDEACDNCFAYHVDGKKLLALSPMRFQFVRYFPASAREADAQTFAAVLASPLTVRTSTVSRNLVFRLGRD